MSNQRQSASSGSQELPAHSLPLLGLLLLCPALHPCPTAPLAGLAGGDGNQPQHHSAGCAVCLALLVRMCLWQQRRHQQTLGSASPAEGPSLLCRGLRYFTGVQMTSKSTREGLSCCKGNSSVIWQHLQYCNVFILSTFADLVSLNSSEAGVNY